MFNSGLSVFIKELLLLLCMVITLCAKLIAALVYGYRSCVCVTVFACLQRAGRCAFEGLLP